MTDEIKLRIIEDMTAMTSLLEQYDAATSEIIATDIDETLEGIVERIGAIDEKLGSLRTDIDSACGVCSQNESELVYKMIRGDHVPMIMDKPLKEIHTAAVRMRSVLISVQSKEPQASARISARVKELRTELQNVNAGRKTTGYSSMGAGLSSTGGTFNGKL